jgi:quinol monooxygenase YgiN
MICLAVTYVVPKDKIDEVKAFLPELVANTRREPGCRMYVVHQGIDEPATFFFYEQYDDQAAMDAHRAAPHFERYVLSGLRTLAERREAVLCAPIP